MNDIKVSIVITCYNYARFLKDSIRSALTQTYSNIEVIVVDDGSTDNTREVVKEFSNVIYIYQENAGLCSARNTGIANSTGDFIFPLDADDVISENFILDSVKLIENQYTIVAPVAFYCDAELNLTGDYWPTDYIIKTNDNRFADLISKNRATAMGLFSKEMWRKVGGYDGVNFPHGYEDWDFWINMINNGCKIKYIREREPYFKYRKHSEHSMLNAANHMSDDIFIQILKKYNSYSDSREGIIKTLYRIILGREADEGGLNHYLHSNFSYMEIKDIFFNSDEYKDKTTFNYIYLVDETKPHLGGNFADNDVASYSESVWKYIVNKYNVSSCLDVGSGRGFAAKYISSLGVNVTAIDGLHDNVINALVPTVEVDLTEQAYIKEVDFVNCVEVVEHIDEEFIDNLMTTLVNGEYVLITHAFPGQEGWHHVNCQLSEYWIDKFNTKGYELLVNETEAIRSMAKNDYAGHIERSGLFFKRLES